MTLRVLFVVDTLGVGGAEKSLLDIVPRLGGSSAILRLSEPGELDSAFESAGVRVLRGGLSRRADAWAAARVVERAVRLLNPDVVHSTLFRSDIAVRLAAVDLPIVSSFVNDSYAAARFESLSSRGRLKLKAVQAIDAFTAGRPAVFFSNSAAIARSNALALQLPLSRVRTIYRGRDLRKFQPRAPTVRATMRQAVGLASSFVVMTVGRLLERKGHRELIQAFASVHRQVSEAVLIIVGDGPERLALESLRNELGLNDAVRFLGIRPDVDELLQLADVFAFPSHFEGFPGALVEAMATALPVVASDIEVHREAIAPMVNGILVKLGDPYSMAAALVEIWKSDSLRYVLSKSARETAVERFDIHSIVNQYLTAYSEVLGASLGQNPANRRRKGAV